MKSGKSWDDLMKLAKWDGVEKMWSTSGDWDWCIKLKKEASTPEMTEAFIAKMRSGNWASETKTNWWKEIPMNNMNMK
jgi:hypothetical protein